MKPGPLKYHGGKSNIAHKIVEWFPSHERYAEAYFGGGACLFAHSGEGRSEFVNDLNGEVVNFWQVLQRPKAFEEFKRYVDAIPFGEPFFLEGKATDSGDPVTRAVAYFAINRLSRQGLGKDFATPTKRLRRGMNENVSAWLTAVDGLPEFHARLRRAEIRCQPALEFIRELDWKKTLFYLDPPYMLHTRSSTGEYGELEMTYDDHEGLLELLTTVEGKFALSGYRNRLYDRVAKAAGWKVVEFPTPNSASSKKSKQTKIECVWMNY